MFRSLVAVVCSLALAAPAALAQSHQEQITVNVVEVPVWVSSFGGTPIKNLKQSDFELYVNGESQPIEYFDVLIEQTRSEAAEQLRIEQERPDLNRRRLYLLVFDLTTLSMEYMNRAKDKALKFVADAPAGETFAVATLRLDGVHFVVPFTTDRVAVTRAVRTLRESMAGDAFNLATLETERAALASAGLARLPSIGEWDVPGVGPMVGFTQQSLGADKTKEVTRAIETQLREKAIDNLSALADSLAPITGVKHVVLLGEGHPRERSAVDQSIGDYSTYMTRLHERYRLAGITLNGVDVRPRTPWVDPTRTIAVDTGGLMRDPQMMLKTLTGGTGGMVAHNFDALREQHSVTYILAFRPRGALARKDNEIRVKVRNVPLGTFVRHRQSFSGDPARTTKQGEAIFLADVLQNDIRQSGLTVGVDVLRRGEDVTLVASVPGQEVLGLGTEGATMMDVFLYVFDEQDVVAWWTHVRLKVDVESAREYLSGNPYRIRQQMHLGPGRYAAKALVRVIGRDATGFQRTDFEVPKG